MPNASHQDQDTSSVPIPNGRADNAGAGAGPPSSSPKSAASGTSGRARANTKEIIWEFMSTKLNESQHTSRSHKQLLREINSFYYKDTNENTALAHQKFCASILWRIMLIPFKHERTKNVDRIIKLFTKIVLHTGTKEDLEEYKFPLKNLPPFYCHILYFLKQCHAETRYVVRARIMELIKNMLERFSENSDSDVSNTILDILNERIKDKVGSVRALVVQCMKYYPHDRNIRQILLEYGERDPHNEVRRQAIIALGEINTRTKLDHICSRAFDPSENVRVEAFIALSKIPLKKIPSMDEREKLVYWGLSQPSVRVQKAVKKYLLPAWYLSCDKNLVLLLKKINPHGRSQVARAVINGLFSDTDLADDDIDRSFLNRENVIPVHELTTTNSQIWYLVCEAFKESPDHFSKVCPNAEALISLLKGLLQAVRGSQEPQQGLGLSPLHTCLFQVLRITKVAHREEASRRQFLRIFKHILREPKIRSCVVIFEAVRLLSMKASQQEEFEDSIETILKEIFDITEMTRRSSRLDDLDQFLPTMTNQKKSGTSSLNSSFNFNSSFRLNIERINSSFAEIRVSPNSTIRQVEEELASVRLQRHKLISLKEHAQKDLRQNNDDELAKVKLLEAEERLITVRDKEDELRKILAAKSAGKEHPLPPEKSRSDLSNIQADISVRSQPNIARDELHARFLEAAAEENENEVAEENHLSLADSNVLRGLIILTGYLKCGGRITNFVKDEYNNFLLYYLHMEEFLIRKYVLYINCFIGLNDYANKHDIRQSMNVCLAALRGDPHDCIRHVAFKCVVDLFTQHGAKRFLQGKEEEDCEGMEPPLNNPNATEEDLSASFLALLSSSFLERDRNLYDTTLKVKAYVKLFLANRLTSESILGEILSLYADPKYGGTICASYIGSFIPIYIRVSIRNGIRVLNAFVSCLHEIYSAQEDSNDRFHHVDPSSFIAFVIGNTSSEVLKSYEDSQVLHETLAVKLLRGINEDVSRSYNSTFLKILKTLNVSSRAHAEKIRNYIDSILEQILLIPQFTEVSRLKVSLKKYSLKLKERFLQPEPDDENMDELEASSNENEAAPL